jgi:hypothetical protein
MKQKDKFRAEIVGWMLQGQILCCKLYKMNNTTGIRRSFLDG